MNFAFAETLRQLTTLALFQVATIYIMTHTRMHMYAYMCVYEYAIIFKL